MKLLRTEYNQEFEKPIIWKFLRVNGKRIIEKVYDFVPYFYVPDSGGKYTAFDGTKLTRIETNLPDDVKTEREKYNKTYEADIVFANRYMIDAPDSLDYTKPRVFYLDIEVDTVGKMPKPEMPLNEINCISIYDNFENDYTVFTFRTDLKTHDVVDSFDGMRKRTKHYFSTEKDMLVKLVEYFKDRDADVIAGWNLVMFDMAYLLSRMMYIGLNINRLSPMNFAYIHSTNIRIKGIALIDLLQAYKKLSENLEESYTLNYIGLKNLNEGKTQSGSDVHRLWNEDLETLIDYNSSDVMLTRKLDEKLKMLEFLDEIRRTCFCQLEDTLMTSRTLDTYVLRLFHNRIVFPSKLKRETEPFEGARIETWAKGMYDNVACLDLKSLYPSAMLSMNLSPETIGRTDTDYIEVNGLKVSRNKEGFLTEVVKNLWENRAKYKKLMKTVEIDSDDYKLYDSRQKAIKVLLNGLYGQTAFPGSRFCDYRIAETVTWVGREINKWGQDIIEKSGRKVIYVDTDSAFLVMKPGDTVEDIIKLQKEVNKSYDAFAKQFNVEKHYFEIEFQKVYKKIFFGKMKKRYCGRIIWKEGKVIDKIEAIGFETRRSDSSHLTKDMQNQIFDMLLREEREKDYIWDYIRSVIQIIREGLYNPEDIGIPGGMSKDPSEYARPTVRVRSALYSDEVLGIRNLSTKPKMVYIKTLPEGLPKEYKGKKIEAICFDSAEQIPVGVEIDAEVMLVKLIKNKLEAIFDGLGWDLGEMEPAWKPKEKKVRAPKTEGKPLTKAKRAKPGQKTIFDIEETPEGKGLKLVIF